MLASLQYRTDVLFEAMRSLFELAWTLIPLFVVFGARGAIAGWSFGEALLVTAWFVFLKALLDGLIVPSVVGTIELIRRGSFDFVLVKPMDAQLWATFSKVDLFASVDIVGAIAIFSVASLRLPHAPGAAEIALAIGATVIALALLYAINIAALSVAFYVARIDNLTYLIGSVFDAARWPSTLFRGVARLVFTFILPLGLMTTYPPLALLGKLSPTGLLAPLGVAVLALLGSRWLWLRGVAAYRSASS